MRVAVFIPCYIDQIAPAVGVATVRLLRRLGLEVVYPEEQTCCGQPAFNTGYWREAAEVAARQTRIFAESGVEAVVCPSGSCAAMQKVFYPTLLKDSAASAEAEELAGRTYELSQFLVNKLGVVDVGARFAGRAVLHRSCHSLRELGGRTEARRLLERVDGLELVDMEADEECCGFGGTFAVKLPAVSAAMGEIKLDAIAKSGAEWVVSGDSSCLMHLGGMLEKRGARAKVVHLAEVLERTG
jgi:L-lactate dehydrogenase complex protein LldE